MERFGTLDTVSSFPDGLRKSQQGLCFTITLLQLIVSRMYTVVDSISFISQSNDLSSHRRYTGKSDACSAAVCRAGWLADKSQLLPAAEQIPCVTIHQS